VVAVTALTPEDVHEWVSFDDPEEERTWVFDVTFLTSSWECIFGQGCLGVLNDAAPELNQGCCSYGAHFADAADRKRIEKKAKLLTAEEWQHKAAAAKKGGPIKVNDEGDIVSRLVDDACIFLNRPGFAAGAGCALHTAAVNRGERPIDWKPEVCWQLPLRRVDETDSYGRVTSTLREWKRRDRGPGGDEFHWWCTETHEAFTGAKPVYEYMRDEIIELVGQTPYDMFVEHVQSRGVAYLPHPALKARS
jgi:hypothetical protein